MPFDMDISSGNSSADAPLEQAMRLLKTLNNTMAALQRSDHSIEAVLATFCEQISQLKLAGLIMLRDVADSPHMVIRAFADPTHDLKAFEEHTGIPWLGYQIDIEKIDILNQTITTAQATYIPDIWPMVLVSVKPAIQSFLDPFIQTYHPLPTITAPLKSEQSVWGILGIISPELTPIEIPILEAFANQLALAIENAQLLESERQRRQEAETLRQATTILTSSLHLNEVLHNILTCLAQVVQYDSAAVFLKEDEFLHIKAVHGLQHPNELLNINFPANDPLFLKIRETGCPLILYDAQSESLFNKWGGTSNVHGWMGIPMLLQNEVVGYVTCDHHSPGAYTSKDALLAQSFANQAIIAIENANLFEQAATEHRHLRLIFDIGREISSSLDPDRILERAINLTCQALESQIGNAFLYLAEENRLSLRSMYGQPNASIAKIDAYMSFRPGKGLAGWVAQNHEVTIINDVLQDERWIRFPQLHQDVRSALCSPILKGDKLLGILTVLHKQPNIYTQQHIRLMQAICQQVSLALDNAQSYQQVQRRLTEITLIQHLAQTFNQRLELQFLLNEVVTQLAQQLHYPRILIFLVEAGRLVLKAKRGVHTSLTEHPLDRGIIGRAATTRQAIFIPRVLYSADSYDYEKDCFAQIAVPILQNMQVEGVLLVESEKANELSLQDRDLLEVLAGQISVALENAVLYEKVRSHAEILEQIVSQRTAELTELYQLSQGIGYALSFDELLRLLLRHAQNAIGCDLVIGCLTLEVDHFLFVETNRRLALHTLSELNSCWSELNQFYAPYSAKSFCMDLAHSEIIYTPNFDPKSPTLEHIRSTLRAPILIDSRLAGFLALGSEQPDAFGSAQERLLSTFANQAASACQRISTMLTAQQQQLESLIEHLPLGVLLLDAEFRILVANPTGRQIISILNPTSQPSENILSHLGTFSLQTLIERRESPLPLEITSSDPNRRIFALQIRPTGSTATSETRQWVITINDITQERNNLLQAQIQERLATVGQLAAGIAHDFNNIMAAILVYTDLLRYDKSISPKSQEKLTIIHQQIERASSLIRQILDFSRRSVVELSDLDLLPFMKELEHILKRILPEVIRVSLRCTSNSYWVKGDPARIQQAILNLVLNARDAMPQGGELYIILETLRYPEDGALPFAEMTAGKWVRICIQDTGIGIPPEELPHIFEPFYTTKPVGQGTGLGLAQVYGIVTQHNGYVNVESQVNQGSKFCLYFPALSDEKNPTKTHTVSAQIQGAGQTVLIVEDNDATREALGTLLDAQGYTALTASNGREALQRYQEAAIDISIIISDMVMPEMGGLELYQTLKKLNPSLKILLVTGHPVDEKNQALLEAGQVQWLQKPFTVQEFNRALRQLLANT